jgi:hypothetical protein
MDGQMDIVLVTVATQFINMPHPFYEVAEVHTASPVCTSASNIWLRLSHLSQFLQFSTVVVVVSHNSDCQDH